VNPKKQLIGKMCGPNEEPIVTERKVDKNQRKKIPSVPLGYGWDKTQVSAARGGKKISKKRKLGWEKKTRKQSSFGGSGTKGMAPCVKKGGGKVAPSSIKKSVHLRGGEQRRQCKVETGLLAPQGEKRHFPRGNVVVGGREGRRIVRKRQTLRIGSQPNFA